MMDDLITVRAYMREALGLLESEGLGGDVATMGLYDAKEIINEILYELRPSF